MTETEPTKLKVQTIDDIVLIDGLPNEQKLAFMARDGSENYYAICVLPKMFPYTMYVGQADNLNQASIIGLHMHASPRNPSIGFSFLLENLGGQTNFQELAGLIGSATVTFYPQGELSDDGAHLTYLSKKAHLECLVFKGQPAFYDEEKYIPEPETGFSQNFGKFTSNQ